MPKLTGVRFIGVICSMRRDQKNNGINVRDGRAFVIAIYFDLYRQEMLKNAA
jgi:hypothetical protein